MNPKDMDLGSKGSYCESKEMVGSSELYLFSFSHCLCSLHSTQDEYEAILGCIEDALDLPNHPSELVHDKHCDVVTPHTLWNS